MIPDQVQVAGLARLIYALWLLQVDCCGLQPGRDTIVFKDDCSPQDIIGSKNYTAAAMAHAAIAA